MWLQDGPASFRLHAQQLRRLPGIGSDAVPILPGMQHIMHYPHPTATPLAADPDTILYGTPGCARPRCGPPRVAAALVVVDEAADATTALLHNVALSSWIGDILGPANGTGEPPRWAGAATRLREAAADAADLRSGSPGEWLKVVAAPAAAGAVRGVWNSAECVGGGGGQPECECVVQVPSLFAPDLYGVPQVPVVMLDMPVVPTAPPDAGPRVLAAFRAMFAEAVTGRRLCVAEVADSVHGPAAGCAGETPVPEGEGPAGPLAPPPMPAGCTASWNVSLYHGPCSPGPVNMANGVSRPRDTPPEAEFSSAAIDLFKPSCGEGFPEFPASWERGYCGAATAFVCVEETQIVRVLLRATGGKATLTVDGKAEAAVAAAAGDAGDDPGLEQAQEADAVLVLRGGCHSVAVVFEDASAEGSNDAEV